MKDRGKLLFFDTKPYDQDFFDAANKKFLFDIKYLKPHLNADTVDLARNFPVVCVFVNDVLDKDILAQLDNLGVRLIALRCAGYNNVDLKTAYKKIHIVRVPGYSPYAVAEHALALMMTLNRKTHRAYYRTRDGNFSIAGFLGFDMRGKTAGIIGTGKIGRCLINILLGMGMNVLAYDKIPDDRFSGEKGIRYVSLDELYAQADVISLHCPLTAETEHMINAQSLNKMKEGVMLINTGRGKLIKTEDLIEALKQRRVGAAGLDVYEEESEYFFEDFSSSMISDDLLARLLSFPNVLMTSHQGFFTQEALKNIAETTLQNIQDYFSEGYLPNEICYRCGESVCLKKGA